jgi:hypothetical protein
MEYHAAIQVNGGRTTTVDGSLEGNLSYVIVA